MVLQAGVMFGLQCRGDCIILASGVSRIYLSFQSALNLLFCPQPVEDVATHVESGYRMEAPEGCPDKIYKIMTDCWEKDPSQRPNFTRIEKALESAASEMPLS